jgi:transglutaminase-like putative cysteine protease
MSSRTRITLASAFATFITAIGLVRLVRSGSWVLELILAIVLVAVSGALLRRGRLPNMLVVLCQLVLVVMFDTVCLVPGSAVLGVLPGPTALQALSRLGSQAGTEIQTMAPPVPASVGISAVLVITLSGVALLVDAIAVTYKLASLAGLPLLALYLVPATRLSGGANWLCFTLSAIAYLALLSAEGKERVMRWGRPLARAGASGNGREQPVGGAGHQIGIAALAAALIVPLFVPAFSTSSWGLPSLGGQSGSGGISGTGAISISEEVNIKRELTTKSNIPLLSYRTNADVVRDQYLRLLALDSFNGEGWLPTTLRYTSIGSGTLPTPPGLTDRYVERSQVATTVDVVGDLSTSPLPLPYPPTSVTVPGTGWDYSPTTLEVFGANNSVHRGLSYTVLSLDVEPNAQQLEAAPRVTGSTAAALQQDLRLPADLPPIVKQTAEEVTGGSKNPYEDAVLLQQYFQRDFKYSLNVPPQDGPNAIVSFLTDKVGYCQQFAGTMAVMARALGIPARVAVGFTAGTRQSDGSYLVTTHDVHSWPELYFPGSGWVRFEPTAEVANAADGGSTPSYAQPRQQGQTDTAPAPNSTLTQPQQPSHGSGCDGSANAASGDVPVRPGVGPRAGASCANGPSGNSVTKQSASGASSQPFSWLGPAGVVPRAVTNWLSQRSALTLAVLWTGIAALIVLALPMLLRRTTRKNRRRTMRAAPRGARRRDEPPAGPHAGGDEPSSIRLTPQRLQALAAWDELRDCATDLGYAWPSSATHRQLRDHLITSASLDPRARQAIGRVTALAERASYASSLDLDLAGVFGDVTVVRAGLAAPRARWQRLRAAVLPASSLDRLRGWRARASSATARVLSRRAGGHEQPEQDAEDTTTRAMSS